MQKSMMDLVAPETLLMASLLVTGLLLFISVYFMITLSDLESDYLNSRQCSDRLNLFTWPRLALLALHSILVIRGACIESLCTKLLVSSESFVHMVVPIFSPVNTMACIPFLQSPIRLRNSNRKYEQQPNFPGNSGLYDPTEVHTRSNLRASIKESLGGLLPSFYNRSAIPLLSLHGLPHAILLHLHVASNQQSHKQSNKSNSSSRNAMVKAYLLRIS